MDKLTIEDSSIDELMLQAIPVITWPLSNDARWIKNAKGEIIGCENTIVMTLEEFKKFYE